MAEDPGLVVVDASVVLKWQLDDEDLVSEATALRDDFYVRGVVRPIAPHLMIFEVTNGIATAVRRRRIAPELALQALENLLAWGVEIKEVGALKVLDASLRYGLAAYDAAYLALAEAEGCDLWTGDRPFYRAVRNKLPRVRWIGDYRS